MQPPELLKIMWMTLRKKVTKNYPHEFQRLGVVVLTASQESGYAAAASIARASEREPCAGAYAELTRPSPFSFPKSAVSEAFDCPGKGCEST